MNDHYRGDGHNSLLSHNKQNSSIVDRTSHYVKSNGLCAPKSHYQLKLNTSNYTLQILVTSYYGKIGITDHYFNLLPKPIRYLKEYKMPNQKAS